MSNGKDELSKRTVFLICLIILSLLVGGLVLVKINSDNKNSPANTKNPNPSDNPPLPEQPSDKYPALIVTKKEPEYKINPLFPISSVGTANNIVAKDNLPAGSA